MHRYTLVVDTPHICTENQPPVAFLGDGELYCLVCAELLYGQPRSAFDNKGEPLVPVFRNDTEPGDTCRRCGSEI